MEGEDLSGRPVTGDPTGEDRSHHSAEPAEIPAHGRLPALIDRARNRLAEARISAEVLEAKDLGDAALHYAKLTDAAKEAQADCLLIISRAEIRLANEIDAAQRRGEVERPGGNRRSTIVRGADNGPSIIADLGLDRRRVAEWRDLAEAGEAKVEKAIAEVLEETRASGAAMTKAAVRRRLGAKRQARAKKPDPLKQVIGPDPTTQMAGDIIDFLCRIPVDKYGPADAAEVADPRMAQVIDRYFERAIPWIANFADAWRERDDSETEPMSPARSDLLTGILNGIWLTKNRQPDLTVADIRAALNEIFKQIGQGIFGPEARP